jgi:hypothetical protein
MHCKPDPLGTDIEAEDGGLGLTSLAYKVESNPRRFDEEAGNGGLEVPSFANRVNRPSGDAGSFRAGLPQVVLEAPLVSNPDPNATGMSQWLVTEVRGWPSSNLSPRTTS